MIVTDEQATAAVIAALNGGGASGSALAYSRDDLKKLPSLPDMYTEVVVSRRYLEPVRNDTFPVVDGFRITARQCSKKNTDNARELRRRTRVNIEFKAVTAGSATSDRISFESADEIAEDDQGYWSGLETYILTF